MPLDFVVHHFLDAGSTTAIQRTFIDMPNVPKKTCMIRQVHIELFQRVRGLFFDSSFALSADPDHATVDMVILDSTIFVSGRWQVVNNSAIGFELHGGVPFIWKFPEGIDCPYTRLPFFVQHSNTNSNTIDWQIKVFYELVKLTPQELAIAIVRRGRAVTRD